MSECREDDKAQCSGQGRKRRRMRVDVTMFEQHIGAEISIRRILLYTGKIVSLIFL